MLSSQGVNRDGKYFPYGQERPSATTDGKEKFATYFRDSETGLDYVNHRYHQPGMGRFMTPDRMTGTPKDPGSWNKYAYVGGDPVNQYDPEGLFAQEVQLGADTVTVDACSGAPDAATLWYLGFIGMTAWDVQQYCQGGSGGGTGFGSEPGGDGGGDMVHVSNYSTTGDQAVGVQNSLRILKAALKDDSDCAGFLKISDNDIDLLVGDIVGANATVGVGNFGDSSINARTGIAGTDLPSGATITVNAGGAFFSSNRSTGYMGNIAGGSNLAKTFILLHELGHVSEVLRAPDDVKNHQGNQDSNDLAIEQNCSKTLNLFGGKL